MSEEYRTHVKRIPVKPLPSNKVPVAEPTPTVIVATKTVDKTTLEQVINEMPELQMEPTQRYYGETYYPQMEKVIRKLKALTE